MDIRGTRAPYAPDGISNFSKRLEDEGIGNSMPVRRAAPRGDPNRKLSHHVGSEIADTSVAACHKHGGPFVRKC